MAMRRMCEALDSGDRFPLFGDGSQSRDFTYVADAVDATVRCAHAEAAAEVYNVGGGEEATLSHVIATLERLAGSQLALDRHPTQRGDVHRTSADVSLARRHLGWSPVVPLDEGLAAQLAWVQSRNSMEAVCRVSVRLAVVMSGFPRTSETFALGELVALARAGMLVRVYATKSGDGETPQPGRRGDPPPGADAAGGQRRRSRPRPSSTTWAARRSTACTATSRTSPPRSPPAPRMPSAWASASASTRWTPARSTPVELADRARAAAGVVACNTDVWQHVARARRARVPASARGGPHPLRPAASPGRRRAARACWRWAGSSRRRASRPCSKRSPGCGSPRCCGSSAPGSSRRSLEEAIDRHGLGETVELAGRKSHEELPDYYAWADVVAVPSVVDSTGDRDGLPNVALEAMACRRRAGRLRRLRPR